VVAIAKAIGKHAGTLPHIVRLSLALRVAGLLLDAVVASLLQGHGAGADDGDGSGEPDDGGDGEDDELHLESGIVGSWVGKGCTCLSKLKAGDRGGCSGEEKKQRKEHLHREWTNAQRFPSEQWSFCTLSQVSVARHLKGQNKRTPSFKSLSCHIGV
jgi:hypothetical protein